MEIAIILVILMILFALGALLPADHGVKFWR
jgi:hypothetical protein